jgi:hypothetical protein
MTSLISWIGFDSRGEASIYLASDSRISWGPTQNWDCGKKLFSTTNSPEIFGFCGDVLFPTIILGTIQNQIEQGTFFGLGDTPQEKKNKVFLAIKNGFGGYPQAAQKTFFVVYCTREYELMDSKFHVFQLSWDSSNNFSEEDLPLPDSSGLIKAWGSGQDSIKKWHNHWQNTTERGTTRSIFGSFCDSIAWGLDNFSGGAPQLVGIYRKGNARSFGIIFDNELHIAGQRPIEGTQLDNIEWRNPLFERCDWKTKDVIPSAQKHKKPKGLCVAKRKK